MENTKEVNGIEFEICVLCGKTTTIPTNLHIDYRYGYIEGVGQLCPECNKKYGE